MHSLVLSLLYYIILGNSYLKFFFQFLPLNFLVYEIRSWTRPRISKLRPMKQIWSPPVFINKVLLEQSHTNVLSVLISNYSGRVELWQSLSIAREA